MPDDHPAYTSIRGAYKSYGVKQFYDRYGASYRNPHEAQIRAIVARSVSMWSITRGATLDLACGSGEVTLALMAEGFSQVTGIDPFTGAAYTERTQQIALPYTFEDIAEGFLAGSCYDLIVSSFALHLVELSRLPVLCFQLARIGRQLLIITPHKRPFIRPDWGWDMEGELAQDRLRARLYVSGIA